MRRRDHNIFFNIGSLVLCGVLAGVVVAAALFPGVAISGLAAKAGAEEFDQLPTELKVDTAPQMSYVYAPTARRSSRPCTTSTAATSRCRRCRRS